MTPLTAPLDILSNFRPGLHIIEQTFPSQLVKVETGSILILLFLIALFLLSRTLPQPGVTKLPLAVSPPAGALATVLSASGTAKFYELEYSKTILSIER